MQVHFLYNSHEMKKNGKR